MSTQTIRLIKPYSLHSKGAVLTLDFGIADALIRSGRAEMLIAGPEPNNELKDYALHDDVAQGYDGICYPRRDECHHHAARNAKKKSNKECRPSKTIKK